MSMATTVLGGVLQLNATRHVRVVPPRAADGDTARAYDFLKATLGFLPPPLSLHSPRGDILLAAAVAFGEIMFAGSTPRRLKEIVASAVSAANRCPYCVDVHTMALHALADHDSARALGAEGRAAADPEAAGLIAAVQLPARGGADRSGLNGELMNVAVYFHYLNRMVNLFLSDSPLPVTPPNGALRRAARRSGGPLLADMARRKLDRGASLRLLGGAEPPAVNRTDAATLALRHLEATCEDAGSGVLSAAAIELVGAHLGRWRGEQAPIGRHWVEETVADLAAPDRPAARLCLLTALASYGVDQGVIDGFRDGGRGDAEVIAATAWASMRAARAAGALLAG